ncbi:transketolase family protein [Singulisphaera acidiphila]|uniref:Transketolase, alpha subunit n=1 Tax=Singulisphaera acidiphila (strain ATCC BAA-1392 / DSM 18658 / VKM B-2454 / MOB10) TaxID=886293 RepID=L0DFM4_SINAD|nr:transketolase C-terminal domain-containing protein [Singulisphaera acidiphila]AGA27618.1 transketolase, alpha subunit [Singulisphaera acidiphila DSM 18658]
MAGASSAVQSKRELGKATRDAFGRALEALGAEHTDLVVVDADVSNSTRTEWFGKKYPDRFFNIGIAESNLVGVAGGLASAGKMSLIASFAAFVTCNAYDQLRMSVAYPRLNVKVVGSHAGISIGEDGASQMGIEDVSLTCSLPGFVVLVPADDVSAQAATAAMLQYKGPVYLRVGRPEVPRIYTEGNVPFTIGKANQLRQGTDVTLIANGLMVAPTLDAAEALAAEGINARVLDMHTVKPIDLDALRAAAEQTGALVVAEEHMAHGGLGSVVAMNVAEIKPVPIRYVNLGDQFGESGTPDALIEKFGMTAANVIKAAKAAVAAKKS